VDANYIAKNRWGIYLSPLFRPENNSFYNNDFVNNTKQVNSAPDTVQEWDNGYSSGGNYWSNYTGIDLMSGPGQNQTGTDGIGDTPFILSPNNIDNHPLIAPFDVSSASLPPAWQIPQVKNNTVALWHFETIEPDSSTPDATGNNPIMISSYAAKPSLVSGEVGQAIEFTQFGSYGIAQASPSLDMSDAISIDVWIKVTMWENTTYNNILVQTASSLNEFASRVYGLALNGMSPGNATSGPLGAVCGYVCTASGYNEIVTLTSAVQFSQWTHIVFTRSLTMGMHIYVNNVEQPVMVTSGSKNPVGNLVKGNLLYLGHDFGGDIDELKVSNIAETPQSNAGLEAFWLQLWFWFAAAGGVVAVSAAGFYFRRVSRKNKKKSA
jgi:hypothetical protein